jgi:Universal stress protein family
MLALTFRGPPVDPNPQTVEKVPLYGAIIGFSEEGMAGKGGPMYGKARGMVRSTIYGYAAREILEGAKDLGVSLIIMGARGLGDLAGLVLGSTAYKVIHQADRPALVVP